MHYPTGFYFFTKGEKKYVIYSTLYKSGRYANTFECTDLTDEQARGKYLIDHSKMVDATMRQKQMQESKHKIILS
jgi:hypothetical protein